MKISVEFDFSDDAMAIFVALGSPEVEVIALTTIFGNVYTSLATKNALHLVISIFPGFCLQNIFFIPSVDN